MTTFIVGFWFGFVCGAGLTWFVAHPDKRAALVEKIKALFQKK
jgi:hypothetical protein